MHPITMNNDTSYGKQREKVRELWEKYQDEEMKAYYETLLELDRSTTCLQLEWMMQ